MWLAGHHAAAQSIGKTRYAVTFLHAYIWGGDQTAKNCYSSSELKKERHRTACSCDEAQL